MSRKNINDDKVNVIALGLYNNVNIEMLNLFNNNISANGMVELSECIIHTRPLKYIDLSGNKSSPWVVYCSIIRHCFVNSLKFCGEKGMNEYVKQITNSLQLNTALQSLTLFKIGELGVASMKYVLGSMNNCYMTFKELNMSWMSGGRNVINRKLTYSTFGGNRALDINIFLIVITGVRIKPLVCLIKVLMMMQCV